MRSLISEIITYYRPQRSVSLFLFYTALLVFGDGCLFEHNVYTVSIVAFALLLVYTVSINSASAFVEHMCNAPVSHYAYNHQARCTAKAVRIAVPRAQ